MPERAPGRRTTTRSLASYEKWGDPRIAERFAAWKAATPGRARRHDELGWYVYEEAFVAPGETMTVTGKVARVTEVEGARVGIELIAPEGASIELTNLDADGVVRAIVEGSTTRVAGFVFMGLCVVSTFSSGFGLYLMFK